MNEQMPRTPFSTPLSGSARETEIRLKNIFSGPKKRPPVLFLALMFSLCIFCGNLVSCQVAEAEGNTDGASQTEPVQEPDISPVYTLGKYSDVLVEGLDNAHAEWNRDTSPSGCNLYFSGDPAFFCPPLAGKAVEGSALWATPGKAISVVMSAVDDYTAIGTIDGFYLHFAVDLETETVTTQTFASDVEGETLELTEPEMLAAARVLARIMTEAEEAYNTSSPGTLPFDQPMDLSFSSGAGAWATNLRIHPDGSFEGNYYDADMGDAGKGYPYGTEYVCPFHGRFKDVVSITGNSWSLTLEELVLDTGHPVGEEWIEDGVRYISSDPYGFDLPSGGALEPGARFMLYGPEAKGYSPTDELYGMNGENENSPLYEFWTWWPNRHGWGPDTTLNCWGLHSLASGYGFFS